MVSLQYWGKYEYFLLLILLIYFLRGFTRPNTKSFLALILFPLTAIGYVVVPIFLGYKVFLLENFLGVIKLLFISFLLVTLGKWIIYFVFGAILTRNSQDFILTLLFKRFPGACLSLLEGFLFVTCLFWGLDYMDILLEKKAPDLYQSVYRMPIYGKINTINPIYDIRGTKDFKVVVTVLGKPELMDRLANQNVFRRFENLPIIRKVLADSEFQDIVKNNRIPSLLMNSLTYQFLKNEDIFYLVTSDEFINACRTCLNPGQLKEIEERAGLFSDINLGLKSQSREGTPKKESFVPDTKVVYKNGNVVEGQFVKQDANGLLLLLAEGQIVIKNNEILTVQKMLHEE